MKIREGVDPFEWSELQRLYRLNEYGAQTLNLAVALGTYMDEKGIPEHFDDALAVVLPLCESPDSRISGLGITEAVTLLAQVWENGEALMNPEITPLSCTEFRLMAENLATKIAANEKRAEELGLQESQK